MSFLIDPPWLYANGHVIAKTPPAAQKPLTAATLAVFLVTSISLYFNRPWTGWIWRLCRARDGRDWMLNSGVFSIRDPGPRTHAASALLFATYPLWLWLGFKHASRT